MRLALAAEEAGGVQLGPAFKRRPAKAFDTLKGRRRGGCVPERVCGFQEIGILASRISSSASFQPEAPGISR